MRGLKVDCSVTGVDIGIGVVGVEENDGEDAEQPQRL